MRLIVECKSCGTMMYSTEDPYTEDVCPDCGCVGPHKKPDPPTGFPTLREVLQ